MLKYDDASWHYGNELPDELPDEAGATHTGMFLAWALLEGFGSPLHTEDAEDGLLLLQERGITPGQFFMEYDDGKFSEEDLNDEGNRFAKAYFDLETGSYGADYEATVGDDWPTLYHVPDTWETFDRLKPVLDRRLKEFRKG